MSYLPEIFDRAVQNNSSRLAVIEDTNRWTFAELSDEVNRIAALLQETVKGDTVGVLLLNSQKYVATMLAIWKAGKTAVPLNYLLPPAELGFIIKDSGMSALVSSQFFAQAMAGVKPLFGDKGVILMADDPAFMAASGAVTGERSKARSLPLHVGYDRKAEGCRVLPTTTWWRMSNQCQRAGDFDHRDSFLCLLPFFHTYAITGTFLLPLLNGSKMVLVDRFQPTESFGLDPGTSYQRVSRYSFDVPRDGGYRRTFRRVLGPVPHIRRRTAAHCCGRGV